MQHRRAHLFPELEPLAQRRADPTPNIILGDGDANDLVGTAGADDVLGRGGDDTIRGLGGDDTLTGGADDDSISGGAGSDVLYGRGGSDTITGGAGDDVLDGGARRDVLRGGDGADTIVGGNGRDRLIGDADGARDVFVFDAADSRDRIVGFEAEHDVLQISGVAEAPLYTVDGDGRATMTFGGTTIVIDGVGGTPLLIDLVGVNDAPVVRAINAGVVGEDGADVSIDLLAGQRDPEGAALSLGDGAFELRVDGTLLVAGDPLYVDLSAYVGADGTLAFDRSLFDGLSQGSNLSIRYDYLVYDGEEDATNTALVTIAGANDAPTLLGGRLDIDDNSGTATFDLASLGRDVDADDDGGTLTYTLDPDAGSPPVSIDGTTLRVNAGVFDNLAVGESATFTVGIVATDRHGASVTGSVEVNVAGANDAPTLEDGRIETNDNAGLVTLDLVSLGGDLDSDDSGDTLTYTLDPDFANAGATISGTLLTFDTSLFDGLGVGDSADVTLGIVATDRHGASVKGTVDVAIDGANDAPVATDDTLEVRYTREITFSAADLFGNDSDAEGGTLSLDSLDTSGLKGELTDNGDGTFTYDPNGGATDWLSEGQSGTDTMTYTVTDGDGGTDTATLTFDVDRPQSLLGHTLDYTYAFPTPSQPARQQTIVVGDSVEVEKINGVTAISIDVTADQIIISNDLGGGALFGPAEFRGIVLKDLLDETDAFDSVTIASVTNTNGFDASRISVDDDIITVNLANVMLNSGARIVLDVDLA